MAAFGAVYPWGYWPLIPGVVALGAIAFKSRAFRTPDSLLLWAAALLVTPLVCQIAPLSGAALAVAAPRNAYYLGWADLRYVSGTWHPVSIDPYATARCLMFVATGCIFVGGFGRCLGRLESLRRFVIGLACIGALAALEAIIQRSSSTHRIYGVWESAGGVWSNYYGSFVNRNHFAGCMLLLLPICSGYLIGLIQQVALPSRGGVRNVALWLASSDVQRVVLTTGVVTLMLVAQLWSLSRSGIAGTTLALTVLAAVAVRRRVGFRGLAGAGAVAVVLSIGVLSKGVVSLGTWYGETQTLAWRSVLWRDSLPALRDSWLVGSGLDTYGRLMLFYRESDPSVHAQQAHNDYLQVAIEGGLLVLVPWSIAGLLLTRRTIQRLREPQDEMVWWIRMGAVAGVFGIALQETVDFSLQIPGVALMFAGTLAIALHEAAPTDSIARRHRSPSLFLGIAARKPQLGAAGQVDC